MAHYKKEITKWLYILLDKFFLDGAFIDKHAIFSAQEYYGFIRFEDGMSLTEFSLYYNEDRKSNRAFLSHLLRLGYLEKKDDPEDNRKKLLYLTARGKEEQQRLFDGFNHRLESILNELSFNDAVGVLKFISKLNQITVDKFKLEQIEREKEREKLP
ncbi:MAG: winged helix DNA-binding protein [Tissierellia bacterium]|nr:winged helix DNA-binding protein [Tissierellia bacterium]